MKKLCLLLILVLLAGCSAQAQTGLIIDGPDEFKKNVQLGVDLLKEKDPEHYKLVTENITRVFLNDKDENCIYSDRSYGMSKWAYSVYSILDELTPCQMALTLVHEGTHAKRIKEGIWAGNTQNEEQAAVNTEKEVAKVINAPPEIVDFINKKMETRWWEKRGK